MLKSLLRNNADFAASKHCDFYILDADIDLLVYALKSLVFNVNILSNVKIITELLNNLSEGRHIELCLNIIIYVDFGQWSHGNIEILLSFIDDVINESEDNNKLILTSNTIMALALCSEFLKRISKTVRKYKRKCKHLLEGIAEIADKLVDNIEDELVKHIFLDKDFKDRTLFKIIFSNRLYSFLSTGKVNSVLDLVWEGTQSTECDGNIYDFSLLTYLASSNVKAIPGKKLSIKQLLFNNYTSQIDNLNFWFQYKFRHESIRYIYYKELLFAAGIAFAF